MQEIQLLKSRMTVDPVIPRQLNATLIRTNSGSLPTQPKSHPFRGSTHERLGEPCAVWQWGLKVASVMCTQPSAALLRQMLKRPVMKFQGFVGICVDVRT